MNKYRIRCGEYYYCGMAYKDGVQYQKWEKDGWGVVPIEMNFNDAECTLNTLIETGKFNKMLVIERVEE